MRSIQRCLLGILIVFLSLSSCSSDNNTYEQKDVLIADNDKKSISKIYDDYEDMQGKDYGNLKMPNKITPQLPEKLFTFTIDMQTYPENKTIAEAVFPAFWKDDYDPEKCAPAKTEGDQSYRYDEDGEEDGYVNSGGFTLVRSSAVRKQYDKGTEVFSANETDLELELKEGRVTVGELIEETDKAITELKLDEIYSLYRIRPRTVKKSTINNEGYASVICAAEYMGVPLQNAPSQLYIQGHENGLETQTFYLFTNICFEFSGKDSLQSVQINGVKSIFSSTALDSIISLKGAAELLARELSPDPKYEFDEVTLMYCCKTTKPSIVTEETVDNKSAQDSIAEIVLNMHDEFVPTWCFRQTVQNSGYAATTYIKVNAVTGEITIDK